MKKQKTLENIVMNTGAASSTICKSSLGDGIDNWKALKPDLFKESIIKIAPINCKHHSKDR